VAVAVRIRLDYLNEIILPNCKETTSNSIELRFAVRGLLDRYAYLEDL